MLLSKPSYLKGIWKASPTQQLELDYKKLIKNHLKRPDVKHVNDWHEKDMNKKALNVGVLAGDAVESLANMIRNKQITPATPATEPNDKDQNSSGGSMLMTNKTAAPDDLNSFGSAFEKATKNKDKKSTKIVKDKKQDIIKQIPVPSKSKTKLKALPAPVKENLAKEFSVLSKNTPLPSPIKKVNPTFKSQIFKHILNHKLPYAGGAAVAGALGVRSLFNHLNKSDDKI